MRVQIAGLIAATLTLAAAVAFAGSGKVLPPPDFNRDVRPILSQNCFKCHGPDDKGRAAGLRLDTRAGALRVLVPGRPEKSELIARIMAAHGGASMMPPEGSNKVLTAAQKETLRRWVASGAQYAPHWSFVPPKQAPLPAVKRTGWTRNAIDRFVLARLERERLSPAPEADRYTLARRVSLDLIGLPPTPEEADAFARDRRPDAYERLVDRLLASPHYGERWARRWLDLARYADTNGYEKDRPRSMWPYRDWVINALNADKPFDQFTVEQLAGDLLPNATPEQRIATGFHRNTMRNEEGGIDPLEYRYLSMVDRVATTGTTWLGMTVACAQCHTHKFDPITHREYYKLFAFLNNCDEPEMEIRKPSVTAARASVEAEARAREARLADAFPAAPGITGPENLKRKFEAWRKDAEAKAVRWTVLNPAKATANVPTLTILPDHSILASGDQTKSDDYDVVFQTGGNGATAIRLEVLPDDSLPRRGPGRVDYEGPFGDFFLSEFTIKDASGTPVKLMTGTHSFGGGNTAQAAIDGDPLTGWSVNGGQGRAHTAVFRLARPLSSDAFTVRLHSERYYAAGVGRFRISVTTETRPAAAGPPPDVETILATPATERASAQDARLTAYFLSVAPDLAEERKAIQKIRDRAPAYPTTLVLTERPAGHARLTRLHHRGEYLQPADAVEPGVPGIMNPLPKGTRPDRLVFARWLVSPANPLTARVAINRQWAAFFGSGIVPTIDDFGYQGESPSHPELLDWLAVEFVRQGWSMKKLHRLIVTSATYRQSSALTPTLRARDPLNRLLARGPRVRLEAELLRDSTLTASGMLSRKVGGPSVFPPQPPGVTTEGAYGVLAWNVSPGEDRYRRGLYTFAKRTAPYAMFTTFDAPSGEACLARREVSNTPLQALALLNDTVMVEAAQALGKLVAARPGTAEQKAAYLFRRCATRPPTKDELTLLTDFYAAQKRRFESKELDATPVAGPGAGDGYDRAAWAALARTVLNLDEVITKR
jgi:hypothetical protein